MLKRTLYTIIVYGGRFGTIIIDFVKKYRFILLGMCLFMLSVMLLKAYHFGPDLDATKIATKESKNTVNDVTQRQINAQHRHEVECSMVRALLKKRNPHMTLARLQRELARMTLPDEIENTRKIIECFKEKPGPNDKLVQDILKRKGKI